MRLFQARRADIECFARDLETRGRARATITRRLCTIAGFYRYAVEEDLLDHSPAAHVRRPRLDYDSHATALDRNELGALLVAAGLGSPGEHALISLLALNGLRVSEATGANIEALGIERGHRGGSARAARSSPSRSRRGRLGRSTWPSVSGWMGRSSSHPMEGSWTGTAPRGSCAGWPAVPESPSPSGHTRCGTRSSPVRGCPAPRRPGSRLACRPAHDDALRPGRRQSRPACQLYSRRLPRRCRAVGIDCPEKTPPGRTAAARRSPGRHGGRPGAVTDSDQDCAHEPPSSAM